MSTQTTRYGRRKLSAEAYARQQGKKKVTSASGIVYGSRKGGPRKPAAADAGRSRAARELADGLYNNPVPWARERILGLASADEVRAIHALERAHPEYDGGRSGVLNALEERLGELRVDDPKPGLARQSVQGVEEEADGEGEGEESVEEDSPFAGDLLPVSEVRGLLEQNPELLDDAIQTELRDGVPREDAVKLFIELEQKRAEGPREDVVRLLEQFE